MRSGRRSKSARWSLVGRFALMASLALALVAMTGGTPASAKAKAKAKAAPIPMNLEIYQGSYYTWLAYLAQAKGFFAQNGIAATIIPINGGGPVAFAALANGSADVAMGDLSLAGPLLERGQPLTAISGAVAAAWELVAPSNSSVPTGYPAGIKALKGQPVGVVALGSSSYEYLQQLVKSAGLGPNGVAYTALGGLVASFVSALGANRVAAAMVSPDAAYYLVHDLGDKLVFNLNDRASLKKVGGLLATTAGKSDGLMWARTPWLTAHPKATKDFQLAMEETDVWMHNPKSLNQVISLLGQEHDLAAFEQGPGSKKFFAYALPDIISYAPKGSAKAFMNFWVKTGLLSNSIPQKQWFSSTMPSSAAQVVAAVRAAGKGSLGKKA